MPRPFTDIALIKNDQPIKNQTTVCTTSNTGAYQTYDRYVRNTPDITEISAKYGYRFYNGLLVRLADDQIVVGG